MTRINCIEPFRLSNQHLVAEYREMLRLRHAKVGRGGIPQSYRVGAGHVKFFYDKGLYLIKRHRSLVDEMKRRNMRPNFELDLSAWPESAMNDWEPCVNAKLVNLARIINRRVG